MSSLLNAARLHVLLVEDDGGDIALIEDACQGLALTLHVAQDALQASAMLEQHSEISLVLLDQGLPGQDGLAWLSALKNHPDPALRRIPVVILSGSHQETQIRRAYHTHASAYLIKPSDPAALRQTLTAFAQFWGQVARLPSRSAS